MCYSYMYINEKKGRSRRLTESNGRWGSDQGSLQGDEQGYQGLSVEGLQNMKGTPLPTPMILTMSECTKLEAGFRPPSSGRSQSRGDFPANHV